jgi:hypothetical protein
MTAPVSPDTDADALAAMIDHLTGPLAAGAATGQFVPDASGKVALPAARAPMMRIVLRRALRTETLSVTATLEGQPDPAVLHFAPFSPPGTALTLWTGGEASAPMHCTFGALRDGAALPAAELAEWFGLTLVEGNLGRVLAVLGDEKARLRRETARLAAMRTLAYAAGDALDRIGAELAVPRLESSPAWNAAREEIISVAARESDADYRRRLTIWRPFLAPTPAAVDALVKQVDPRLAIRESNRPMAVAVRIVGSADDAADPARQFLLARVRTDYLVFLNDAGPGPAIHGARPQPAAGRAAEAALRTRLAAAFSAAADAAVAPRLAQALERAARVLTALGSAPLTIERAQAGTAGSRYELGMGVSIKLPSSADADTLRARLLAADRAPGADSVAETLIRQARDSAPAAGERTLAWLWTVAGMATVHMLGPDHIYVSHLSTNGLTIDTTRGAGGVTLRAVFNAPGDPGRSAALQIALDRAAANPTPGYALVADADVAGALGGILDLAPGAPENQILAAAGLPASTEGSYAATALRAIPGDLWSVFALDAALTAKIKAGDASAIPALAAIVATLRGAGLVSLLPLLSAARCLLVASVVALPTAGVNLGERIATGVRWVTVPLTGSVKLSNATGFVTKIDLAPNSLAAVVALGYVRNDSPDPYEVRVDLPDGALLDLAGYERLMNALERIYAIGVEVNTWDLRQRHVDLDVDGLANPLPPRLARHYRQFRMPRRRGMEEPDASSGVSISLQSG